MNRRQPTKAGNTIPLWLLEIYKVQKDPLVREVMKQYFENNYIKG